MQLIASLWWLWLAVFICCAVYVAFNQVRRFKRMFNGVKEADPEEAVGSFFAGIGSMAAAAVGGGISFMLFVAALVITVFGQH